MKTIKNLFTALLLLCATVATAHDFEVDGIYYNILSEADKTVEVTYGTNNYTGSVAIPESVVYGDITYSVTSIRSSAFYDCRGLTSIEIPNSVTSIGNGAFNYCTSLKELHIADGEGTLSLGFGFYGYSDGKGLFYDCPLETLYLGRNLSYNTDYSYGYSPFYNIKTLTSVIIGKCVTNIGDNAFYVCRGLTSIEIPNNVTIIGNRAFVGCIGLPSIEIPNSVTSIGNNAFDSCTRLTSITIPNSVTSIGWSAFYNCSGIKEVHINDLAAWCGIDFGDREANPLYYAKNLYLNGNLVSELVIPDQVTEIKNFTFSYCTGLTSIEIPNSVTSIGNEAFSHCTGLTSIQIPNSVTSIDSNAFIGCTGLTGIEIPNSVTNIGWSAFYGCTGLTSIEIPNSVTSIGEYAFCGCSGLKSVVIGNSVTSMGMNVFEGCTNLTSVEIPNSVTSIGNSMFYNCTALTSIEIPNSVTSIGDYAFSGCSGLTSVKIPNSVTSIGESAFSGCTGLTSITIPNSVTSIGSSAFSCCTGLTSVEFNAENCTSMNSSFDGCTALSTVVFGETVKNIPSYAFYGCTWLTSIVIGNGVTSIGEGAFSYCTGLTSITSLILANKLFTPGNYAFNKIDKTTCTLYVPVGAKSTYASTASWSEFANIVELEPEATEVTVTINQYGSATYCSPYALDFSEVEGLKAYAATGYKSNSQVVTLTRLQTAEAGIGLFLKGEPGEYVVPVIESTDEHSLNMLVGTLEETVVNSTTGEMSNYKFTIADGDAAPMFYPFEDNTTFSAGKAYLQIPTAWLPATAQKSLSIRFDDGETTGVDELKGENGKLKGENGEVKTIYDLSGRVVENPTSGIYIINGKKVVVK